MKTLTKFKILLVTGAFVASASAFADCWCTQEWIWGGCAVRECGSTLSSGAGGGSRASSAGFDQIHFHNSCSRPIQTAIQFLNLNNQWQVDGWFTLQPGQDAYVAKTRNTIYNIYGETIDPRTEERVIWTGNDSYNPIRGSSLNYGFQKRQINSNQFQQWTQNFSCDGVTRFNQVGLAVSNNGTWSYKKMPFLEQAKTAALADCQKLDSTCYVAAWLGNAAYSCMGLVRNSDNRLFWTYASDLNSAINSAMTNCNNASSGSGCVLQASFCND